MVRNYQNKNTEKELKKAGFYRSGFYGSEISIDISFSSVFTAVTLFFAGLLIREFPPAKYGACIDISILFLIISSCGFLYSTLIYANATGIFLLFRPRSFKLSKRYGRKIWSREKFERCILIGTTISEYIGVYFLVLSIPLVIQAVTINPLLQITTLIMILLGLFIYHVSGYCVMSRHFKCWHYHILSIITILEVALFFSMFFKKTILAYAFSGILILFIISLAVYVGINAKKLIENIGKGVC